jgi:hypothetical protein
MVVVVPVPVVVPPGVLVRVHVPEPGNPLKTTLPVGVGQVGCMIVPTLGADNCVTVTVKFVALIVPQLADVAETLIDPEVTSGKVKLLLGVLVVDE